MQESQSEIEHKLNSRDRDNMQVNGQYLYNFMILTMCVAKNESWLILKHFVFIFAHICLLTR